MLCVVNLDPNSWHEATLSLDLDALGVDPGTAFEVVRRDTGQLHAGRAPSSTSGSTPTVAPGHVFHVRTAVMAATDRLGRRPAGTSAPCSTRCSVRGFDDSNGDGTGDLRGLTEKLDYLEWLGVDCLWLLPFYQSPLRDGGYDISDFFTVLPAYGDVKDAAATHRGGAPPRHPRHRRPGDEPHERPAPVVPGEPPGRDNPKADWYVWGDDDQRWSEARIIFVDTEPSNWTYDPLREQYYWHRFFHHQPDLNFDNPEVQEAMLDVVRFWLDLGLDGFRLDAVPYLFERDGTNGENLPETHEYLKRIRQTVDTEFPGRVLLAEANQWPADVVEYFGDGDECHMCFHFPLMPRMFMAHAARAALPDHRDPRPDARRSPTAASGASSCATTTS